MVVPLGIRSLGQIPAFFFVLVSVAAFVLVNTVFLHDYLGLTCLTFCTFCSHYLQFEQMSLLFEN